MSIYFAVACFGLPRTIALLLHVKKSPEEDATADTSHPESWVSVCSRANPGAAHTYVVPCLPNWEANSLGFAYYAASGPQKVLRIEVKSNIVPLNLPLKSNDTIIQHLLRLTVKNGEHDWGSDLVKVC